MSKQTIKFFGSNSDLHDLREALLKAGFKEHDEEIIRASHDIIPPAITILVTVGTVFTKCVQTFLREHGKRMVSRTVSKGKEQTVMKGYSLKEIARILKSENRLNIEADKKKAIGVKKRARPQKQI